MKIKSYYWAIIAAAGLVLVVLASMAISSYIAEDNGRSPHSQADIDRMRSEIDYSPQIQAYQDLIAADPDDYQALLGLGIIYARMHRYDEAAKQFEGVVRVRPEVPIYHGYLGESYYYLQRNEDAARQFEKGLELDPNEPAYYDYLGTIYLKMGRIADAEAVLLKGLTVAPNYQGLMLTLGGELYADELKQYDKARAIIQQARDIDPSSDMGKDAEWMLSKLDSLQSSSAP